MTIGTGAHQNPNTPATTAELYQGMICRSQNHLGGLGFDLLAFNDFLAPFLGAGFYYKTFMWPASFWEKIYEPMIRRAAGLGALSGLEDPSHYDKGHRHADVLIIGGGVAGLRAGVLAGRAGLKTILADEDFHFGGQLLTQQGAIDGKSHSDWLNTTLAELASMDNVTLMPRTTIFGTYDHGIYGALERRRDHLPPEAQPRGMRQIMWKIMAKTAILASGASERPLAFSDNDRPGIMLASAVCAYAQRFGVATGKRITLMTNNDSGIDSAIALHAKGLNVDAVIDSRGRAESHQRLPKSLRLIPQGQIVGTHGRRRIKSIILQSGARIATDCLAIAGGWSPNLHLTCHQRAKPIWDESLAAFLPPRQLPQGMLLAGAVRGDMSTQACLNSASHAATTAIKTLGKTPPKADTPKAENRPYTIKPLWRMGGGKKRQFVDLQNDVTAKDITQAHQEGYRSVEHLKRYTTLGMATDQGKSSNLIGLALLAEASGKTIPETGTTMFRPPYTPVRLGRLLDAIAGVISAQHA